ncbi:HIRA-interacting protein 5 [Metschnikowia bicuspidata var. bicuspidata NRRL YB-4993]|uniref:HIRA-interacting protein 5 n=1 Tax=Metschnikowia bicuspidata var. bicuspidata NRRL YB-4993 TaxID=869754 RepID=A0A1A0HD23_9ASCO|nr:HIRA-interacting protein 5 [Metschnikowia bicuspidata var. bicuspidata NRRL YB-4993]OBA21984.1 HIRA-interacting protein 5 [Metschnikowia bicuspidata var. bicuspidata NRRL YB-4993]
MFSRSLLNTLLKAVLPRVSPRVSLPLSWSRNLFIQTADTPNENALKFLPSMKILGESETMEFLSGREAACSPLAMKLFSVDGVKSIMLGPNFITIEKVDESFEWALLKPEIFSILTEGLTNGTPILDGSELSKDIGFDEEDDEVISMIKELIFTRIRPAIQDDGGDIEFVNFVEETGTVFLRLKGACRTCDSSSVTLKNGIESMLKHYIEEVEEVKQVEEEVEEADESFAKFEAAKIVPQSREDSSTLPPSL